MSKLEGLRRGRENGEEAVGRGKEDIFPSSRPSDVRIIPERTAGTNVVPGEIWI